MKDTSVLFCFVFSRVTITQYQIAVKLPDKQAKTTCLISLRSTIKITTTTLEYDKQASFGFLESVYPWTKMKVIQYSAGCSLPLLGVLWQLSGCGILLCSWSPGHQLGRRGENGSIWARDVGTAAPFFSESDSCEAVYKDVGPGVLRIAILHQLQCERVMQFWN